MKIINKHGNENIIPVMVTILLQGIVCTPVFQRIIPFMREWGFVESIFGSIIFTFTGTIASILLLPKKYLAVISQLLMMPMCFTVAHLDMLRWFWWNNGGDFFPLLINPPRYDAGVFGAFRDYHSDFVFFIIQILSVLIAVSVRLVYEWIKGGAETRKSINKALQIAAAAATLLCVITFFGRPTDFAATRLSLKTFTDSRDGKTYRMATIDGRTWMAENLNFEAEGSKCYDNKPDNCRKYGRLYDWETAVKACPAGWRIPHDKEWEMLMDYASYTAGDSIDEWKFKSSTRLKSSRSWKYGMIYTATDDYGFSALPGGSGYGDGTFDGIGYDALWWSVTVANYYNCNGPRVSPVSVWQDYISFHSENSITGEGFCNPIDKTRLLSVRCVLDSDNDNDKDNGNEN